MTTTERIALWDAINRYAQMCGGDTSAATVSGPRERAVSDIERLIEKLEQDRRPLHGDSSVATLEAGRAADADEDLGIAGDHCGPGNECGRLGCPNCQA